VYYITTTINSMILDIYPSTDFVDRKVDGKMYGAWTS
jgi:hypothetical protein